MQPEAQRLAQGARALGVALQDAETAKLLAYLDLLERWNATYNLTAVRARDAMLTQHVLDCVAIVPAVRRALPQGGRVLDVGSGGGLPGVVLAVLAPELQVTCVDTVGKKAAFVLQVAGSLALPNLASVHGRVEALKLPAFELVTSRAFASLADFVRLTRALLAPGGGWLAMKGRQPDDEVAALPPDIDMFHVEQLAVPGLDAQRSLVWMRPRAEMPPRN
jgi:16S rRNA (guanine527-N7)-methyltransferase